jgi:hypothetical protein
VEATTSAKDFLSGVFVAFVGEFKSTGGSEMGPGASSALERRVNTASSEGLFGGDAVWLLAKHGITFRGEETVALEGAGFSSLAFRSQDTQYTLSNFGVHIFNAL